MHSLRIEVAGVHDAPVAAKDVRERMGDVIVIAAYGIGMAVAGVQVRRLLTLFA